MGHRGSPDVAKSERKNSLACQALNPGHPATLLAKPLCNQLVYTKIKLTLHMLLGILTIKFDEVLWQSVQFEQSGQIIHEH
jgi:hypothetical protein